MFLSESQSKTLTDTLMAEHGELLINLSEEFYFHDNLAGKAFYDLCEQYGLDKCQTQNLWIRCFHAWRDGFWDHR